MLTHKAQSYLENKLKTKVRIGEINLAFPKSIFLGDIYIESLQHDTLVFSHSLKVDIDMFGLLHHKVTVNSLKIEKFTAHVKRTLPDSTFNFSFIMKAFASAPTAKPATAKKDTAKKPFVIAVYGVYLHDFYVTYNDAVSGMDADVRMGKLDVDIHKMDLDHQKISIKKIDFENTYATLFIGKKSPTDTSASKPANYDVNIDDIKLAGIKGIYKDKVGGQTYTMNLGNSDVKNTHFQLGPKKIDVGSLDLEKTFAAISINENSNTSQLMDKGAKNTQRTADSTQATNGPGWMVSVKKLNVDATAVDFDNMSFKAVPKGMDYNHIGLKGINMRINDVSYKATRTAANIQQLGFSEKSGFAVRTLRTKVEFDSIQTELADFDINTGNTHIARYISLRYKSLDDLAKNIGDGDIKADVAESIIGYRDILYFVPGLEKTAPFSKDPDGSARIAANIFGKISDLNLNSVLLTAASGTMVHVRGNIKNLPNIDKTLFDLDILEMHTTKSDISYFSPPHAVPKSINLPQRIGAKGYFKGYINNFRTYVTAQTSLGSAIVKLQMKMPKNTQYAAYTASVSTNSLQLGELLNQQKTLGPLTMNIDVTGTGLSLPDIDAQIKLHVTSATAMKYPYKNLDVAGRFSNQAFNGTANMKDSNLEFAFKGIVGVNPNEPVYKFELNVAAADLQALHLMDSDMRFKGILNVDVKMNKDNDVNGTGGLRQVVIVKNGKSYPINSFGFFSATHGDNDSISIRSDFLNADFAGTIQLSQLPSVLEAHLNKYFNIPNNKIVDNYEIQKFKFNIELGRTDLITEVFYPKIQKLVTGPINGFYNSKEKIIKLNIDIPEIEYNNITMDSLKINVNSDAARLNYTMDLGKLKTSVLIKNINLKGKIEHDSIGTALTIKDDSAKTKFMLAAAFRSFQNEITANIKKGGLVVNYEPWEVSPDNYIKSGKEIYAHNVVLSHKTGSLSINSPQNEGTGSPMDIDFKNFSLGDFTGWIQKDTLLAGGIVNGKVVLKDITKSMVFNVDMGVEHFSYKNDTFGNLKIAANNNVANKYQADISINGPENDASVKGFFDNGGKKPSFNFDVNINKLTLEDAAAFTKGQVSDLSGFMEGKLLLVGTTDNPKITGNLHFNEAGFTLDYLNSHYKLHNENVVFNTTNIAFKDFSISDSADHKAVINGYIYTKYFNNFKYNLKVKTDHFLALNSQPKKDQLYYGKLLVTSQTNIKGDVNSPIIDLNAHLEKGTFMQVVLPRDEPSIEERKGVVFFKDINRPNNKILYKRKGKGFDTTQQSGIKGMELASNIEVDKDARMKIIVDQEAGDYLDVKGAGTLSMGIRPDGTLTLTGRYEILEGSYQMTFYDFVKRRFTIQQGGSIIWLGSPMNAEIDLTARYETRTAPLPILEPQLAGLSDHDRNIYRQQLRFQVLLKMSGALKKPDLNMDITLNDLDKGAFNGAVTERLTEMEQDKSELNKQVFALLVLNRFIDENFTGDGSNVLSDIAYSSVSELVSQQLNNIASKLLKKGSLSFDVRSYQDYATGNPVRSTDFKGTLQEQFLNDRLTINLGGDLNVEGTDNLHPKPQPNQVVSDLSVEYMLTKDGRYRVMVFRDNAYAGIIEGQLVETGAGIIFVKDFNSFDKLFTKPENDNSQQEVGPSTKSAPK